MRMENSIHFERVAVLKSGKQEQDSSTIQIERKSNTAKKIYWIRKKRKKSIYFHVIIIQRGIRKKKYPGTGYQQQQQILEINTKNEKSTCKRDALQNFELLKGNSNHFIFDFLCYFFSIFYSAQKLDPNDEILGYSLTHGRKTKALTLKIWW